MTNAIETVSVTMPRKQFEALVEALRTPAVKKALGMPIFTRGKASGPASHLRKALNTIDRAAVMLGVERYSHKASDTQIIPNQA